MVQSIGGPAQYRTKYSAGKQDLRHLFCLALLRNWEKTSLPSREPLKYHVLSRTTFQPPKNTMSYSARYFKRYDAIFSCPVDPT